MNENHKALGARGEAETAAFLEARGYQLVDANVRPLYGMARGEIDLVAWQGGTLVFVEVKTRRRASGAQGTPGEAITPRKRRQLVRLASAYIARYRLDDVPCRFDVVEVIDILNRPLQISLLVNAFDGSD
jgi:putative endonuclease